MHRQIQIKGKLKTPMMSYIFEVEVEYFRSSWKKSMGIESTGKMWLVTNSEIKVGKEQVDHEIFENEMTKGFWIWYATGNI